jgi:ABC-type antimicrobial peptide transport system permease subunit
MRLLLTLVGILIAISLVVLACADLDDGDGADEDFLGAPIMVVGQ